MDLDLEADSASTTVKQAETFAAVRETWNIPRQENLKLRDFPTLRHVVKFVYDNRPIWRSRRLPLKPCRARRSVRSAPGPLLTLEEEAPCRPAPASPSDDVVAKVLAIVADKTGYPPRCSRWTSTSRPTSASTPSSRPRPSRRSGHMGHSRE